MTTGRERDSVLLDSVATLAVAAFSMAAALGMVRVFGAWDFVGDAIVVIAVGHGLSWAMRRTPVPGLLAVPILALVLAVLVGALLHPETFSAVFPGGATVDAVQADWRQVSAEFAQAVPPVPYEAGWALLAVAGLAAIVLLGDTFAFRAGGRGEVLVPGAVLFVFVGALGNDRLRIRLTLVLIAAGVLAVAALRVLHARPPRTALGPRRHPLARFLPAGIAAALVIVLGAWTTGPRLPGADAEPWVDTRQRDGGGGVIEVISPLVDIRSRLVEQTDTPMFAVQASAPANWRVSALPEFDGTTWGLPQRSLDDIDGQLAAERPASVINEQAITVAALGGRLVPAAADPIRAEGEGLRYSRDTETLVRRDRELAAGDVFAVTSAMPSFTADQLRTATVAAPPDAIYLQLPDGFPAAIGQLAAEATASASNPYDRVRTLQDWFRANFDYSLEVPAGHSVSAIEAFLERRSGYCEQFAGTFAAMARALGIPARVAVGFTPGTDNGAGGFSVLGRNAHAWPEIWFDGYGWVSFEPTPGRGAPGAENHTGVAPEQDAPPPPAPQASPAQPLPAPSTTVNLPDDPAAANPGTPDAAPPTSEADEDGGRWRWLLLAVIVVGAVIAAPAVGRRLRRVASSSDPAQQTAELWARARRAVETSTGDRLDPALTPLEQARQVAPTLPVAARPLRALAEVATAATYSRPEEFALSGIEQYDPSQNPGQWCHDIEVAAYDALTPAGRVRHYFTDWH